MHAEAHLPDDCPVCSQPGAVSFGSYSDEEYFTSQDTFDYWVCTDCGSVYLHPVPVARLSEIYPSNYYSFQSAPNGFVLRAKEWMDARYFRRALRQLQGDALRILDVGGGAGHLLNVVRSLDSRVRFTQVVDLDSGAGKHARAAGHEYVCSRIEEFQTQDKFDLILALNLIEHVHQPRTVLEHMQSLLSPGGLILIKTPNIDALDARLFRRTYWAGLHVPRHWTLFTRASFDAMASRSGLEIHEFAYTQGAPFWAASVLASLHRRGWVRLSQQRPAVKHPLFSFIVAGFAVFDLLRLPWSRTSQMQFMLRRTSHNRQAS